MKMWMTIALLGVVLAGAGLFGALRYMTVVPGVPHRGPLPPLQDVEVDLGRRFAAHVRAIAQRPHNVIHFAELERVAAYIERELASAGFAPATQPYAVLGKTVRNIEAVVEPADPARFRGTIVVGAHYDSYADAPGANDNGSGVAAVLELARSLADLRGRTDVRVRLALFVNEEPPHFKTPAMGSYRYAQALAQRREPVIAMLSLETIGWFRDEPGTQQYPAPFGLLYPSEANFIAFVGLLRSRPLLHALIRSFRSHTAFPTVGGVAPGFIPGIDWSDHWSFEQFGYPSAMITDTALYRYPHYHLPSDTPEKIDYEKLARITKGIERVIRAMARTDWPTPAVLPR